MLGDLEDRAVAAPDSSTILDEFEPLAEERSAFEPPAAFEPPTEDPAAFEPSAAEPADFAPPTDEPAALPDRLWNDESWPTDAAEEHEHAEQRGAPTLDVDRPFAELQGEVEAQLRVRLGNGSAAPHPYLGLPWSASASGDDVAAGEPPVARTIDVAELRSDDGSDDSTRGSLVRQIREWAVVVVLAVVAALAVQTWVVQLYEIPSESMYPTLKPRDRVVVNKLAYRLGSVERGDLIVFRRPESERATPDQPDQMIKRVVGVAGDVVEARGGVVYIDGAPLDETGDGGYLDASVITANLAQPVTVKPGHVFVMGDNRESSRDSRFFGPVPEHDIIGRAAFIGWPPSRWGGFAGD